MRWTIENIYLLEEINHHCLYTESQQSIFHKTRCSALVSSFRNNMSKYVPVKLKRHLSNQGLCGTVDMENKWPK
jgi:hypothetical protein